MNANRSIKATFELKGKRIIIRPLKRDDIDKRLRWGRYRDPLYANYNLQEITKAQKRQWYLKKKKDANLIYLAIDSIRGRLLGFLSLYEIKQPEKTARIGIYLRSEYTNKRYGTEAIKTLLTYYFESLKFRELRLDVAAHNLRAIRCYRKCGFEYVKTFLRKHDPRSKIDIFGNARFKTVRKYFKREGDNILVRFEEMRLTRKMWRKL